MLNDRQIRNAKPQSKLYKLSDGKGLFLAVTPAGGKLWRLKYYMHGKEKLLSIGKYPDIPLAYARQLAEQARAMIAKGIDPSVHKQQEKAARKELLRNTFKEIAH